VPMDARLAKRHKRQVSRAKQRVRLSEPDIRTPEQIKAARDASRASLVRHHNERGLPKSAPVAGNSNSSGTGSAAKTAV
jgi:hypothetical protein